MTPNTLSVAEPDTVVNDIEVEILLETEEALTEEDREWLQWLACDFEDDDDYCIEKDHAWIRRGC